MKRAKLNLRNSEDVKAFHRGIFERRFGGFVDGTLVDVYIDITGYKETYKRPEMLKCVMRINSKRFVHGIMKSNDLDISRTYTLSGEYLQNKNTAVFSLVDGVTLRTIKEAD